MRRISREYDSTVGGRYTSVLRRDDVTDLLVGAVRWVEFLTATKKLPELSLESGQLALSRLNITEFRCQQRLHVGTRHGALTAQIENAGDLYQCEPGSLPSADERKSSQHRGVVLPVPVWAPQRRGKQATALVEADGLRRHARLDGYLSDAHDLTLRLDLAPRIKV